MNDLPNATLFLLMSVDGKISTGGGDERDFDKDLPNVAGVKEGLHQYYELEEKTDLWSFNTGRCMAKVGWNEEKAEIDQLPVAFVILDNKPHLTALGVSNLCKRTKKLYIVTTNPEHPAHSSTEANLEVVSCQDKVDFTDLFRRLKQSGADNLTVQSGGEMNARLVREGLINNVSIVVAPLLVGGRATPTLIDGPSLATEADLHLLKPLKLVAADILPNSYLHLRYKVL